MGIVALASVTGTVPVLAAEQDLDLLGPVTRMAVAMHTFHPFLLCLLPMIRFALGKVSIELPIPLYDSSISRIYDPIQLEAQDANVLLQFPEGQKCRLICTFDNAFNMSAFDFEGSDEGSTVKIPLPLYQDGPHTITARVLDAETNTMIDFAEAHIEVRTGWNNGDLRDPLCPLCEFTTDWTKDHIEDWGTLFADFMLPAKAHWTEEQNHSGFDLLEIGSWEGRCDPLS